MGTSNNICTVHRLNIKAELFYYHDGLPRVNIWK